MPRDEPLILRLLRTHDLIDLRLTALDCTLESGPDSSMLLAGPEATLTVYFPPQHLGEEVWQVSPNPPPPPGVELPPKPGRASRHIAAGPSRLVYALPEGIRIPATAEGVLAALLELRLVVAPAATPAGEANEGGVVAPTEGETAIEAPFRLVVSPSQLAAFVHEQVPKGPPDRFELWRTRLGVRSDDVPEEQRDAQRIVRAVWNRDRDDAAPALDPLDPALPLTPTDRRAIVEQTSGGYGVNAGTPLAVRRFELSSLGAWLDWGQTWSVGDIVDYRHQAVMGRDSYVRVAYPGILFPFGHRCLLLKITEREVKHRDTPVAYLWQRFFIIVRQPTRGYPDTDRDNPFGRVTISPLVTPDLDTPAQDGTPFVPTRGGVPFPFTLTTTDRGGEVRSWAAPLVFVQAQTFRIAGRGRVETLMNAEQASSTYLPVHVVQGRGQTLAVARPAKPGDTSVEVGHLVFDGVADAGRVTARPFVTELRAVVPAMRHLAPQAPAVDLTFARSYLDSGLPARGPDEAPAAGTPNAGEVILALKSGAAAIDFSGGSDRSGGFISPNVSVRGVSRALGATGDDGAPGSPLADGRFDPASLLSGALPKLFGLFDLLELLDAAGLGEAPAFVSDTVAGPAKVLAEAQRLRMALDAARDRLAHEVTEAAHGGAAAIAQQAHDQLAAVLAGLVGRLDAVVAAAASGNLGAIGTALAALPTGLDLLEVALRSPGVPAAVRSELAKPASTLRSFSAAAGDAAELARMLSGAGGPVTARLAWRPVIKPWGLAGPPTVPNIFKPKPDSLRIDVEVRAAASAPPAVDILAEIVDFELNLIGDGATGLMQLAFRRIGFHAGSAGKPDVDVVFGGMKFLGPLAFVDRLREIIPFDGFSDPPFLDVTPDGVRAGFDLTLPNVSIGVFSLENISLGADARVPFLGDAMTVGFNFCSKDRPFRLTVMCIGGGGWLALRAAPKGLVLLELGLEACACLSVDLGVASGSVSIAVGVYLRLEATKGLLTAYFRIRGEVDVLGLISASITLELSLTYHFESGKLMGRASLVVEIEILFFSASVEISVERQLAGSKGDPTMYQIMPPDPADGTNADWTLYCDAFAPVPAA